MTTFTQPTHPCLSSQFPRPDLEGYIDAVAREGEAFARATDTADVDALVAACPGWSVRDLVVHVGLVHLWAATNVKHPSDQWLSVRGFADLEPFWPQYTTIEPSHAELAGWYRSTHTALIDVLRSAPPDHDCLTFLPAPTPLVMWARRQASEIAIHRFDLEKTVGLATHFEPGFAADMLHELVVGFVSRMRPNDVHDTHVMRIIAEDVGDQYFVTIGPSGVHTSFDGPASDLTVRGSAADLYVALWNRSALEHAHLEGDRHVLEVWRTVCDIRWR